MKLYIISIFLLLLTISCQKTYGQSQNEPQIFMYVEQMPEAPYNLLQYFKDNIQYPGEAIKDSVQGTVRIKFVVNEDGKISGATVAGTKKIGHGCEEEALRLISHMPPWNPGKQNSKAVNVYYVLPVVFKIQ